MTNQEDGIAWTDFTSNPIRYRNAAGKTVWGCVKVSAGCANCYAAARAHRFRHGPFNAGAMAKLTPYVDEKELRTLLTSKKISGKRVFIGDMTDIFGAWVPSELLDRMFAVFALRPDVTFQILTKRPERMREYLAHDDVGQRVAEDAMLWTCKGTFDGAAEPDWTAEDAENYIDAWPLPNVWLGFSAENQETFDARWPHVAKLADAGWLTFVSAEPLLGPIHMTHAFPHERELSQTSSTWIKGLHWVIVGGESAPGARPCHVDWIRALVSQCAAAGVPCFVKQLGSDPRCHADWWLLDTIKAPKGGDPAEWSEDLRVREFPAEAVR